MYKEFYVLFYFLADYIMDKHLFIFDLFVYDYFTCLMNQWKIVPQVLLNVILISKSQSQVLLEQLIGIQPSLLKNFWRFIIYGPCHDQMSSLSKAIL